MGVRSLNNSLQEFLDTFIRSGTDASLAASAGGLVATGGIISEYTEGSTVYRAHIFTSTGTFDVTSIGGYGSNVEYLLVAGGGAGGSGGFRLCGGGGAGGLLSNHPDVPASAPTGATRQAAYPVSPGSYTVSIGAGGAGATNGTIVDGSASNFYPTPVSYPSPTYLRAFGGGGGGGNPNPGSNAGTNTSGNPGGSGGGNTEGGGVPFLIGGGGSGTTGQGSNGGRTGSGWGGAGGGGAGEAGCQDDNGNIPANPPGAYENGGYGGDGMQVRIAGPTSATPSVGTPGTNSGGGYFAGGGGGSYQPNTNAPLKGIGGEGGGGYGIVWPGGVNPFGQDGLGNTGGGGGGAAEGTGPGRGGNGGSGVAVIRYQIGSISGTAKATGGIIGFSGGKTIHTFIANGTFTVTNASLTSIDILVVGGGGGSGGYGGGGGGGLVYQTGKSVSTSPGVYPISIGAGGASAGNGGSAGGSSVFTSPSAPETITANGGGGGEDSGDTGGAGGSGGGGGWNNGAGGPATQAPSGGGTGYGNPGGTGGGSGSPPYRGGGGGGAGGAGGGSATTPEPHAGGVGRSYSIVGITTHYSGGGGGGRTGTTGAPGGLGGGGTGGGPTQGVNNCTAGQANTGGGGGGGSDSPGCKGGSGIIIIAYPS